MFRPFFRISKHSVWALSVLLSVASISAQSSALDLEPQAALKAQGVTYDTLIDVGITSAMARKNPSLPTALKSARELTDSVERTQAMRRLVEDSTQAESSFDRPALALELGDDAFESGLYSDALNSYATAWSLSQLVDTSVERSREETQIADRALAGRAGMLARLGRTDELATLFESVEGRAVTGRSGQLLRTAKEGLHLMQHRPDLAFLCGPTALQSIYQQANGRPHLRLREETSTPKGVSLARLATLSEEVGMELQLAYREKGAAFVSPAVVHWGVGHYAAILESRSGYLRVVDPTFVSDFWMQSSAVNAEASGYFLIPKGSLPAGWRAVEVTEAQTVWGRGSVQARNSASTRQSDHSSPKNRSCGLGMAVYSAHLHMVSLNITDVPVAYTPPFGPEVAFELNYVERDLSQPAVFTHGNLGPQWLHNFHSFVEFDLNATIDTHSVTLALPSGGFEEFTFETAYPVVPPTALNQLSAQLSNLSAETGNRLQAIYISTNGTTWQLALYRLTFPDGTVYTYSGAAQVSNRLYLASISGVAGGNNQLSLGYTAQPSGAQRLETITDATGGVSEVLYSDRLASFPSLNFSPGTTDPLHVVGFLDPAGRHAQVHYDASGRVTNIVDAVGIESVMTYAGATDQVDSLTTPYGTSTFSRGTEPNDPDIFGWLELTDPLGRVERLEYTQRAAGISPADVDAPDPAEILMRPQNTRQFRNTFYWDKQAWALHGGDYTKAYTYHWLHSNMFLFSTGILESYQAPLENRVYYNYPGMLVPEDATLADTATLLFPSKIARVDDDGNTWLETREYNDAANITRFVDAAGRITEIEYAPANGLILAGVSPVSIKVGGLEVLHYTYGDTRFPLLPTQIQHAGESPIILTYNSAGQVLTSTQETDTTTYIYDQPDGSDTQGNLLSIVSPDSLGTSATFTYDSVNRVQTVTDSLSRTITFAYDDLDRPTTTTFPDGTSETTGYGGRLFPESMTDRLGRLTTWEYDAAGQLITQNAFGLPTEAALQGVGAHTTRYQWCDCGSLTGLIDPAGNHTQWEHDALGRVVRKVLPDGRETTFRYTERMGRLEASTRLDGTEVSYK